MTYTCHVHGNRDSLQITKLTNKDCLPSDLSPYNSTQGSKLFNQQPRRSSLGSQTPRHSTYTELPTSSRAHKQAFFFLTARSRLFHSETTQKFLQETLHRTGCLGLPSDRQSRVPSHRLSFSVSTKVLSRTPGPCLIQRQAQFTS